MSPDFNPNFKFKTFSMPSFGLGGPLSESNALPNASKYKNPPTKEQIQEFIQNKDKIVDPIVITSLKKHPEDVLHGSQSLHMLVPGAREPHDWDLYSPKDKQRAQALEKSIDNKVKADIAYTVKGKLPQVTAKPVFNSKTLYHVKIRGEKEPEIDVMDRPKDLPTFRFEGITHESMESQHYKLDWRANNSLTKMINAVGDRKNIENYLRSKGKKVPKRVHGFTRTKSNGKETKEETNNQQQDYGFAFHKEGQSPFMWQPKPKLPDRDNDTVPDIFDCAPDDPTRQGKLHDIWMNIKQGGLLSVPDATLPEGEATGTPVETPVETTSLKEKLQPVKEALEKIPKAVQKGGQKAGEMVQKYVDVEREKLTQQALNSNILIKVAGKWKLFGTFRDTQIQKFIKKLQDRNVEFIVTKGDPNKNLRDIQVQEYMSKRKWKEHAATGVKPKVSAKEFTSGFAKSIQATQVSKEGTPRMALSAWGSTRPPTQAGVGIQPVMQVIGPGGAPYMAMVGQPATPQQYYGPVPQPYLPPKKQVPISHEQYQSYIDQGYTPEELASQGIVDKRSPYYQEQSVFSGVIPYRPVSLQQSFLRVTPPKSEYQKKSRFRTTVCS